MTSSLPFVIQYNKRDLSNILSIEELREMFNPPVWRSLKPGRQAVRVCSIR